MYDELVKRLRNRRICIQQSGSLDDFPLLGEASDAIEELSRENESLAKSVNEASEILRRRWIPVTERLPDYGTTVLVYGSQGGIYTARYERARAEWGRDSWWKLNSKSHICNPTHWMPLPQPPKEET